MLRFFSPRFSSLLNSQKYAFSELKKFQHSFLNTTNLDYIESLYEQWLVDKSSVSPSFAAYFELLEQGKDPHEAVDHPSAVAGSLAGLSANKEITKQLKMRLMIETYRSIGHQFAKIDPLDLPQNKNLFGRLPDDVLKASAFGFEENEMNESIVVKNLRGTGEDNGPYTVKQFQNFLTSVYCDKVGFEYTHLLNKDQRNFIKTELEEKIELLQRQEPTKEEQLSTLGRLAKDQAFIDFLGIKFSNFKRFGIEGLNSGTTALGQLAETAAELGVQNIVVGMAHRGRLNALHCVFQKPAQKIFKQFLEKSEEGDLDQNEFAGDVKYHLGYTHKRNFNGKEVVLQILPNPSHLQAVNPLVYGSARAIQQIKKSKQKVLGVIIHGDAAVAGQGVVYQSIQFEDLVDYSTGGIIHIVFNNQIGFTTLPKQDRSSYYCTEIAKAIDAPIIHVNANVPDILDKCMKIAVAYRQKFQKDIFIDIVGFRRHGHNQQDQPIFTQPLMYEAIKNQPTCYEIYSKKLLERGIITKEELEKIRNQHLAAYEEDYKKVISEKFDPSPDQYEYEFSKIAKPKLWGPTTGVPRTVLSDLFKKITTWPANFNIHPIVKKLYEERIKLFNNNEPLDWPTLESLCWASVLQEGYGVRVSGEDCERGPFSQRHALISDQKNDIEKYCFLKSISDNVRITNSHLSEYGVLGFEYGYSITNPNSLVIWEAQFGDFMNGAQIMIDNFIVSAETKWGQQSGIVVVLPHGMDGQGPEHSQARIERVLDLTDDSCDEDQSMTFDEQMRQGNIQVINCTNGANYFHALRRQVHRDYRKPLFSFNSKKLLKYKPANQLLSAVEEGTDFVPVYPDDSVNPAKVKRVLIVSGQFYYDVKNRRDELKRQDTAIIRIEQLAPFPHEALRKAVKAYGPNVEYYFAQEEHENFGVFNFLYPRLNLLLKKKVGYFGRPASASPAVGSQKIHFKEQEQVLKEIFAQ